MEDVDVVQFAPDAVHMRIDGARGLRPATSRPRIHARMWACFFVTRATAARQRSEDGERTRASCTCDRGRRDMVGW